MKGIAYTLLIVVASSLVLGPIFEVFHIFAEKSRIDSSINNCGRLAAMMSADDGRAADMEVVVDIGKFVENFNQSFAQSLGLKLKDTSIDVSLPDQKVGYSLFEPDSGSETERYNDFSVTFSVSNNKADTCDVSVKTRYVFKTSQLKFVEDNVPGFANVELDRKSRFVIDMVN